MDDRPRTRSLYVIVILFACQRGVCGGGNIVFPSDDNTPKRLSPQFTDVSKKSTPNFGSVNNPRSGVNVESGSDPLSEDGQGQRNYQPGGQQQGGYNLQGGGGKSNANEIGVHRSTSDGFSASGGFSHSFNGGGGVGTSSSASQSFSFSAAAGGGGGGFSASHSASQASSFGSNSGNLGSAASLASSQASSQSSSFSGVAGGGSFSGGGASSQGFSGVNSAGNQGVSLSSSGSNSQTALHTSNGGNYPQSLPPEYIRSGGAVNGNTGDRSWRANRKRRPAGFSSRGPLFDLFNPFLGGTTPKTRQFWEI